jgi:cation:H+ antiporter
MIVPLAVHKSVLKKEIPIMLGVSLLLVLISIDGEISQYDGVLLLACLGVFAYYTFRDAMKQRAENKEKVEPGKKNIYLKSAGLIGIGIVLLYVGAILTVDNAVVLAQEFGLSEKIIGLTVIAIGTSLPELITSIIAASTQIIGILVLGELFGAAGIAIAMVLSNVVGLIFTFTISKFFLKLNCNNKSSIKSRN